MGTITAVQNRILQLCRERNITVNKLANISALPPSTLKNVLSGVSKNPTITTLKILCDGLGITLFEFFNVELFGKKILKKVEDSDKLESKYKNINTSTAIKYRILQLCKENQIPIYKQKNLTSVPTKTVSNILYDKTKSVRVLTIEKICNGFGITLAEFFNTDYFNGLEQEIK